MNAAPAVLEVRDLSVTFPGDVWAVRGLDYDVARGEVLGLVGESGCGKTASALAVMGLLPGTAAVSGSVRLASYELTELEDAELSRLRGKRISMIFQDPLSALTPVYTVGDQIAEAVRVHNELSRDAAMVRAVELLELVGIPRARERVGAFPHEFSGGMRQRVMIAMALSCEPDLLIADEPTTALDVTIQAQVLEVLEEIKQRTGSAILLITHDLGVVAGMADRVLVMYAGKAVEQGRANDVFYRSQHPYTLGLLSSLPRVDEGDGCERLRPIEGTPASLIHLPSGCSFHPRCAFARLPSPCSTEEPSLGSADEAGHCAACHFAEEVMTTDPVEMRRAVRGPAVLGAEHVT